MDNIFAQLQMLSVAQEENPIQECRKQLNKLVAYMRSLPNAREQTEFFAKLRHFDVSILDEADGFMVDEALTVEDIPEEFRDDRYDFCHGDYLVFSGRYVYPVKDVHGDVMGFCGYDKFEDMKYKDSRNLGYIAKRYSVYGMEKLPEYYKSNKPVFFVEGIACCLYLRQMGFQACALLGSTISPYVAEIIRRFGDWAIVFPDADEAGSKLRHSLKYILPTTRCVQSRVAKDIDDSRMVMPDFYKELEKLESPFWLSPYLM